MIYAARGRLDRSKTKHRRNASNCWQTGVWFARWPLRDTTGCRKSRYRLLGSNNVTVNGHLQDICDVMNIATPYSSDQSNSDVV